ncbi:3474_t:CDS:1, partial [Funneliformis mosseae]
VEDVRDDDVDCKGEGVVIVRNNSVGYYKGEGVIVVRDDGVGYEGEGSLLFVMMV